MIATAHLLANVGTPLMWAGMFHLIFGNAIIGVFEGLLLGRIFRVRRLRAVFAMCGANYLSMGVTVFALEWRGIPIATQWSADITIENVGRALLVATAFCLVASAVFEWPFCYFGLRGNPRRFRNSIVGTVLAQAASYVLLIACYLTVSPVSVLTKATNVPPGTIPALATADVYYINEKDGDVYRIDLAGREKQRVAGAGIQDRYARLYLSQTSPGSPLDLGVSWGSRPHQQRIIVNGFLPADAQIGNALDERFAKRDGWMTFGGSIDLQCEHERTWNVRTGFWQGQGLVATNESKGTTIRLALETPFLAWSSRCATVLPHGQVVYQLGRQIVLLDLNDRQIALLTKGNGPLVVLRPESACLPSGIAADFR